MGDTEMTAMKRGAILLLALMLAACGVKQAVDSAQLDIREFHARLDRQDYDGIWKKTAPEFRKASSKDEFSKLLAAVHAKLGKVKSSEQTGWQANTVNGTSTIVIAQATVFEQGQAQETFTFERDGEDLKLLGYNINAPALIYN